jgi:hypothetical protein
VHEYDATLKGILTRAAGGVLAEFTGLAVTRWHSGDLPAVRHRRADLLGETATGAILHIELQSTNHAHMARRMLEYSLAIHRKFGRFPEQLVLYVGNAPLRMKRALEGPGIKYECRMLDIRACSGDELLASPSLEDNVMAILAFGGEQRDAVRRILDRIASSARAARPAALVDLMTLAGLRKLGSVIEHEVEKMPILDDIMDHEVLGRERKRGIELGREETRSLILRLVVERFGTIPPHHQALIDGLSPHQWEKLTSQLLRASSLDQLLKSI